MEEGDRHERGRDDAREVAARHADRHQEKGKDGERRQDWNEEDDDRVHGDARQRKRAVDDEQAGERRICDSPTGVIRREGAVRDDRARKRIVLSEIRTPVRRTEERKEPHQHRQKKDREEGRGRGPLHASATVGAA